MRSGAPEKTGRWFPFPTVCMKKWAAQPVASARHISHPFCARFLRMSGLCQVSADTNLAIEKFYFSIFALYAAETFLSFATGMIYWD